MFVGKGEHMGFLARRTLISANKCALDKFNRACVVWYAKLQVGAVWAELVYGHQLLTLGRTLNNHHV